MDVVALIIALVAAVGGAVGLVVFLRRQHAGSAAGSSAARADPFTIGEPWRRYVAAAQAAQRRYRTQVQGLQAGPLKARMAEIGMQLDRGVQECWDIARRGHQLDGAIRQLNAADLQARLDKAKDHRESVSLRAQLGSVERIRTARNDADERLRVLQTRLGELVGTAAEMTNGVHEADPGAAGALGSAVDDVVTQLEALRLAVREVNEPLAGLGDGTAASA